MFISRSTTGQLMRGTIGGATFGSEPPYARWLPQGSMTLPPAPRDARLEATLERTSRRLAESATVLGLAEETRYLARAAHARSRLLLSQREQIEPAPRRNTADSP
jgi:hypothetical protein